MKNILRKNKIIDDLVIVRICGFGLILIFILDRINKIDWIYCFLGFQTKPRNNNPAFSGKRKLKKQMVLLPSVKTLLHSVLLLKNPEDPVDPV